MIFGTRCIQKSNNPSPERLEELVILGSDITRSADFWPRLFLNPEMTMVSGPIRVVDAFFFVGDPCLREK